MISQTMHIQFNRKRQAGFSLMEAVIAISLSLVVTASMVALMSNSLGNTTRIIGMTKLSDDMRSTMQMLTRDVRRTSYNANALFCYGNDDCHTDGSLTVPGDIIINGASTCFTFLMDRDHDGDSTENNAGGFRWVQANAIGSIEMWVGNNSPDCADTDDANWAQVTNPDSMDITTFTVNNGQSYDLVIFNDGVKTISQRVRKLRFAIAGRLISDNAITRRMEDVITVRNDLLL
jgi:type IV pilus assembly protein PilW